MFLGRSLLRPCSASLRYASHRTLSTQGDLHKTVKSLADRLKTTQDLSTIHYIYPTFVEDLRRTKLSSRTDPLLHKEDVMTILQKLASSGRPQDIQRIEELFNDLEPVFEIRPSLDLYTATTEALSEKSHQLALDFLKKMPSLPGSYIPNVDHFVAVLDGSIDKVPFEFIQDVVSNMHRLGCRPNAEVANIVIRAFWKTLELASHKPTPYAFSTVMDLLESWQIPYSTSTSSLIASLFDAVGLNASGQKTRSMYEVRFQESSGSNVWASRLARTVQTSGVRAAIDLFKTSPNQEANAPNALRYIIQSSQTLSDIELIQKELGVRCDVRHWTTVISNCTRANHLQQALSIYEAAKASGIRPDAGLVAPILRCLWRNSVQKSSNEYVYKALSLYADLLTAFPPSSQQHTSNSSSRHSRGPDANIYHSLFRLLSRSKNVEKYYPVAEKLLKDMEAYNLPTNVSAIAAPMICLGIQRATSTKEAMEEYNDRREVLDEDGYAIVLQHFSKKQFRSNHVPAIQDYFDIVKHMGRAGIPVTTKVYSILLTQIGYLATKLHREGDDDDDFKYDLITVTRQTHDLLSLDASLSPDAIILSQLINTYQRLGCFGDAYRVWELMYLIGNFNCVTVSNILDGCGYAHDLYTANAIWRKLSRDGFSFDLNNWNTWVECLCRCDQLDMARKVVIQDMPNDGKEPTLDTVQILVKFAKNKRTEGEVLSQIEKHFPSLSRRLPYNLKSID